MVSGLSLGKKKQVTLKTRGTCSHSRETFSTRARPSSAAQVLMMETGSETASLGARDATCGLWFQKKRLWRHPAVTDGKPGEGRFIKFAFPSGNTFPHKSVQ